MPVTVPWRLFIRESHESMRYGHEVSRCSLWLELIFRGETNNMFLIDLDRDAALLERPLRERVIIVNQWEAVPLLHLTSGKSRFPALNMWTRYSKYCT